MSEVDKALVSVSPVVLEVVGFALMKGGEVVNLMKMMESYPNFDVVQKIEMVGRMLGPELQTLALVALGTVLVAELGLHIVEALVSGGNEKVSAAPASEAPQPDILDKPMSVSHAPGAGVNITGWKYGPSSDDEFAKKVEAAKRAKG